MKAPIREADAEALVDEDLDFHHLRTKQLLIEEFEPHAIRLFELVHALLLAYPELDIGALLKITTGFRVFRVEPQLDQLIS